MALAREHELVSFGVNGMHKSNGHVVDVGTTHGMAVGLVISARFQA